MTEHITGRQARELLNIWSGDVEGLTFAQLGADRSYGDLFGAAPALAETVAWLYGQTGQDYDGDWQLDHHDPYYQFAAVRPDGEGRISLAVGPYGQEILLDPDEAVEVARALLTAAEDARRHTD